MEPPCLQNTTAKTLAMAGTTEPLLLLTPPQQRHRPSGYFAWGWTLAVAAVLVMLLLLAVAGPLRPRRLSGTPPETVELTLLTGAAEKGAVCLDGTAPGYHMQRGSGSGSKSWLVHLQNVREVLPKDCLTSKNPTECLFPAEIIKSIRTPMFILNSGYDSKQIRLNIAPDTSGPDKEWMSCKDNISNCNSTQIEVLDGGLSF
ncbi:hypothetical protein QYE76_038261 [Lolium multiflorum]|uniref:Pectin acetylesterase n=1 Tax=Lolium multiflorum TaxID=4521 RepID=A0AAD8T8J0_LOLMU|nr:hypothetical protein QYE76_038261 [Lolium multiflorum]